MTTQAPQPYRLAPGVILVPVEDGTARLLDMGGSFFALSKSGAEMVRGIIAEGVPQTVASLARKYGVEPARIEADLASLLRRLEAERLVEVGSDRARAARIRTSAARSLVPFLLRIPGLNGSPRAVLALARMSFVTFGWADTVAAFKARLMRDGRPIAVHAGGHDTVVDRIDAAVRGNAATLPSVACKERALTAWYLLAREGIRADLVVGLQLYPLGGHCWCEVAGRIVTDFADHCRSYSPVARYDAFA